MTAAFEMTLETLSLNRPYYLSEVWSQRHLFLFNSTGCEHQAKRATMSSNEDKRRSGGFLFVAAMPYLHLNEPLRDEFFAFVGSDDPSLEPFKRQCPAIARLMDNFRTPFGYSVNSSALLLRSGTLEDKVVWEAAASLRNAFAISSISCGWQRTVGDLNCRGNLYADQYDFYPLLPSASGDSLKGLSPAQTIIDVPDNFHGQTYPDVPVAPTISDPKPDRFLWKWLLTCWRLHYFDRSESWQLRALFRSLAYVFRAARMPKGCDHLLFDFGINVSLWYAALECLVHPEDSQVGIIQVLECLGKMRWQNRRLMGTERRRITRQSEMDLNFVQRVAHDVYSLRNNFLHGNPISMEDLTQGRTLNTGTYTHVLPLAYQVAIQEFVYANGFVPRPPNRPLEELLPEASTDAAIEELADDNYAADRLEEALIAFQLGRTRTFEERLADIGLEETWVTDPDGTKHRLIRKKQG